jgi:hypothetical protein
MILPPLPGDDDPRDVARRVNQMAKNTRLFGSAAYRHLLARMPMSAAEVRHARVCMLAQISLETSIEERFVAQMLDPTSFLRITSVC